MTGTSPTTVSRLLEGLPGWVRLGPFDVPLRVVNRPENDVGEVAYGTWSSRADESFGVTISDEQPSAQALADTLLHELVHGIDWAYNLQLGTTQPDENVTARLATALVALHRDNPWLGPWLARSLKVT